MYEKMDSSIHKNGFVAGKIGVLVPFITEPWKRFTLSEIKKITKIKSHHYAYEALEKLISMGIVLSEKTGNTNIYWLNPNPSNFEYLCIAESLKKEKAKLPTSLIETIRYRIATSFYALLVVGSYAKSTQKKSSDIDVCVIIPNSDKKKHYEIALKEGELTKPEIHGFVFTEDEFLQILINEEFNYGKECARNHVIVTGSEAYYKILFGAVRNGFKG